MDLGHVHDVPSCPIQSVGVSKARQQIAAVIAARAGSRALPNKNLADFCGRPLLQWSIEQASVANGVGSVWVSSDSEEILRTAAAAGAQTIRRPNELSGDDASSETAWAHALDRIEVELGKVDTLLALQATSPLRETADIERGLTDFSDQGCDSLFSAAILDDFLIWERRAEGQFVSLNYDSRRRARRQDRNPQYVENGSFYVLRPEILRREGNRLGGRIGVSIMEFWKSFEIDTADDLELCATLMRHYGLAGS